MRQKKVFLLFVFFLIIAAINFALTSQIAAKAQNSLGKRGYDSKGLRIAVFPFSDHSFKTIASVEKLNKSADILRNLDIVLKNKDINVVQNDLVERLLLAENIIRFFDFQKNPASYEWNMINSAFSPTTNDTIIEFIINRYKNTVILSRAKVISLAKDLDADLLVRGVILNKTPRSFIEEDKIVKESEGGISKRVVPFFLRDNFCYASTSSYESGLPPFNLKRPVSFSPFFKPNKSIIQVLIFIQDGKTGSIIWSTNFKVRYFSKNYYLSAGFNDKVRKQIDLSMEDFFSKFIKKKNKTKLEKRKKNVETSKKK